MVSKIWCSEITNTQYIPKCHLRHYNHSDPRVRHHDRHGLHGLLDSRFVVSDLKSKRKFVLAKIYSMHYKNCEREFFFQNSCIFTCSVWLEIWGLWFETWGYWFDSCGYWFETWGIWFDCWGSWLDCWGDWLETWGDWFEIWACWLSPWFPPWFPPWLPPWFPSWLPPFPPQFEPPLLFWSWSLPPFPP